MYLQARLLLLLSMPTLPNDVMYASVRGGMFLAESRVVYCCQQQRCCVEVCVEIEQM